MSSHDETIPHASRRAFLIGAAASPIAASIAAHGAEASRPPVGSIRLNVDGHVSGIVIDRSTGVMELRSADWIIRSSAFRVRS